MRASLSAGLAFAAVGLKRRLAYRAANWAGLFTNTFFLLFRVHALLAFYAGRTDAVAGYTAADGAAYIALTQALIMVIPQWGRSGLGESVRSGQIAVDLARPVDYYVTLLGQRLGESAYYVVGRAVPLVGIAVLFGFLGPIGGIGRWLAVAVSVALGAWIGHTLFFLFEASAFWLERDIGPRYALMALQALFGGLILPLAFFPPAVRTLSAGLPFEYTLHAPVALALGRIDGRVVAVQFVWAVGLALLARAVVETGRRRLVVLGG